MNTTNNQVHITIRDGSIIIPMGICEPIGDDKAVCDLPEIVKQLKETLDLLIKKAPVINPHSFEILLTTIDGFNVVFGYDGEDGT